MSAIDRPLPTEEINVPHQSPGQVGEGRLTDIGEYQAHMLLESLLNSDRREIGDDCAVYDLTDGNVLLVNVDRLALNVEAYNRARLCVAQTFSDIICMGGIPEALLVALTLPRDTKIRDFKELMLNLRTEVESYGARLIGGDTKEGSYFHLVGVGIGKARRAALVRRIGARPGMLLGVTSTAGRKWGLRWANAVIRELAIAVPDETSALCREADKVIRLPAYESQAVISTGHVRAGLDLSDGVGGGLRIIARASDVGVDLDWSSLTGLVDERLTPVADQLGLPLCCFSLSPGYNWENMYVVDDGSAAAVAAAAESAGGSFTIIGSTSERPGIRLGGIALDEVRLSADEKFVASHTWEDRFTAWVRNCRDIFTER
jgi:thiamine-monophosphate kinase